VNGKVVYRGLSDAFELPFTDVGNVLEEGLVA